MAERPDEVRSGEARSGEARLGEARPGEARPGEARPGEARPGGSHPVASFAGRRPDLDAARRMLLIRIRSIGDTVLMTPCISAINAWRPDVEVDVLLEPFCAPVLAAHPGVSNIATVGRSAGERARVGLDLRRRRYDIAIDLNGGSTATLLALASGAGARVGFAGYRFARAATCCVTSSLDVWRTDRVHTVEHQLALVAGIGIPVDDAGPTSLRSEPEAGARVERRLADANLEPGGYAVFHPEASMPDKQWPADHFAALAAHLASVRGLRAIVVGKDPALVAKAAGDAGVAMADLSLADTLALVERSALFVGNDSGPAHIAAAFARPTVVVFGPSNVELWRPWSRAPWRVVHEGPRAADSTLDAVSRAVDAVLDEAASVAPLNADAQTVTGGNGMAVRPSPSAALGARHLRGEA